jgi:hypothetical protein
LNEADKKSAFSMPVDKSAVSLDRSAEGESPTLSVAARMLAVRQLQRTSPLAGSTPISVPPSVA